MHDPRKHVVDLGEFLVDEENALAAVGQQPRELIFVENVCHVRASSGAGGSLNHRIKGAPIHLQTTPSSGCAIPALQQSNEHMLAVFARYFQKCKPLL
jgi:hypothetical protein